MQYTTYPRLVGDIGGTNARFAWIDVPGAPLGDVATYPAADYATLQDAMRKYLADHAKPTPRCCSIGIANPVTGDKIQMTNHHWSFSIAEVQHRLGFERFVVINDFTALALSLPGMDPKDLRQVGPGEPVEHAPIGLIGPGTGLGVSGLLPASNGPGYVALNGEGGHVTLAATDAREEAVIAALRRRFGHPSAERALSGPGLVNLHAALCDIEGAPAAEMTAAQITGAAMAGSDRLCNDTVDVFFSLLGTVAGNLAITLGSRGGLYIGGGIVARMGERIDRSSFREKFEAKGRFKGYLSAIPTYVVQAGTSPALVGAARALDGA